MIPRVIHTIVVGGYDPSPTVAACMDSVIAAHHGRGWQYKLHVHEAALLDGDYGHPDLSPDVLHAVWDDIPKRNERRPWCMRADLLKLLALYRDGGFVLDADMHCVRPLDRFVDDEFVLAEVNDFLPGVSVVGECLIGAPRHDPRVQGLLRAFVGRHKLQGGRYDTHLTGWTLVKGWQRHVYPMEVFCPHWRGEEKEKYRVTSNTHFIHCFGSMVYDLDRLKAVALDAAATS